MEVILLEKFANGISYASANEFYEACLAHHPISDEALNAYRRRRDRAMIDRLQMKYSDKWRG